MLQGGYNDGYWDNTKGLGRFPANFIHDGSDEVRECFPENVKGEIGRVSDGQDDVVRIS